MHDLAAMMRADERRATQGQAFEEHLLMAFP